MTKRNKKRNQKKQSRRSNQEQNPHPSSDAVNLSQNVDVEEELEDIFQEDDEDYEDMMEIYRKMPKVELHAHLSGSLSVDTVKQLFEMNPKDGEEVIKSYKLKNPKDMDRVFDCFPVLHALLQTPESLELAVYNTVKEFVEDGCVYLELRTTPKETRLMSYELYLSTCIKTIEKAGIDFPSCQVFLIVSIDRAMTLETAGNILNIVGLFQLSTSVIVGVELSGRPEISGAHLHPIFVAARRFHGLGVTIHLAEDKNHMDDVIDYLNFLPDRIGHGSFLHLIDEAVDLLEKCKIPLEICLSSNVYTGTTKRMEDSHYTFWKRKGVPVVFCTDDKGIIPNTTLSEEYYKAGKAFGLTFQDFTDMNLMALRRCFACKYNVTNLAETYRRITENRLV